MTDSGWTILTLKEHIAELRADDHKALAAALAAADKAVQAALESVKDGAKQADAVAERRLAEAKEDLKHRLDGLNKLREDMAKAADLRVVAVALEDQRARIEKLEARVESNAAALAGRGAGQSSLIAWVVALVGIVGGIVGIVIAFSRS